MNYDELMSQKIKKKFEQSEIKKCCNVLEVREIMLPMRDNTKLHTVIYLPNLKPPYHTVVTRTCYTMYDRMQHTWAREYCERGFAFVFQYCRGIGTSEGKWVPNLYEYEDGVDTFRWLNDCDWCQNMGYYGFSYGCYNGFVTSDALPDKMKTMFLSHFGIDRYATLYRNGMFKMDFITNWVLRNTGIKTDASLEQSCRFLPHVRVDEALWNTRLDFYREWVLNVDPESECWTSPIWNKLDGCTESLKIPIFLGSGWYDHHLYGTIKLFEELNEDSAKNSYFRIGPWTHFFKNQFQHEDCVNIENNDILSSLEWFQSLLVEEKPPEKRIFTYVIGDDRWVEMSEFPTPNSYFDLYLGSSETEGSTHRLTLTNPSSEGKIHYEYDSSNPVPSMGGAYLFASTKKLGSVLQPEVNAREDVISFVSDPLDSFIMFGDMLLDVFVSSDEYDSCFCFKVSEVLSDGRTYNIRNDVTSLSYATKSKHLPDYVPGETIRLSLTFDKIAWKLQEGSRIRLDISSSDFMQYNAHTNLKGIWSLQEKTVIANQTIRFGSAYECRLRLPIFEEKRDL